MDNMKIESAKYVTGSDDKIIETTIDSATMAVPTDPDNRHYAEILKQVKEGKLTIKDAD